VSDVAYPRMQAHLARLKLPRMVECVDAVAQEDDGEPFEEKMKRLMAQLTEQMAESRRLDETICKNLDKLGFTK